MPQYRRYRNSCKFKMKHGYPISVIMTVTYDENYKNHFEEFKRQWQARMGGALNKPTMPILDGSIDWIDLSISPEQQRFIDIQRKVRKR